MADLPVSEESAPDNAEPVAEEKPKARRRPRARKAAEEAAEAKAEPTPIAVEAAEGPAPIEAESPKRRTRAKKKTDDAPVEPRPASKASVTPEASNEDVPGEPRRGWWQRTFG
jgi:ribonuclease E